MYAVGMWLFFFSIFFLVFSLFPKQEEEDVKKKFEEEEIELGEGAKFVNVFRPVFQLFLPLVKKFPLTDYREKIEKFVITAGMEREVTGYEFLAFQITTAILFSVMSFILSKGNTLFVVIGGVVGLAYPYLWLYEKKKTRQQEIVSSMPNVVDMLSLSVEAGLDFNAGIKKVCDIYKSEKDPFVEELYFMNKNMKLGKTREEALKTMAERVDTQELHSFSSTLVQAEKMGSNISDVLKSQAVRMRQERFMNAEKMGAAASQKLLIPMILFIFPLIFIIIFGPIILQFIYKN